LIVRLRKLGIGCKLFDVYYVCLLYADDILLLSHSVNAMRRMLAICDQFAVEFDLKFNTSKSLAMRIGNRYSVDCAPFTLSGGQLKFTSQVKYLGVYLVAAKCFTTSVSHLKVNFFAFLTVFIPVLKLLALEIVNVQLLKAYCLPFLLYASESVSHTTRHLHTLNIIVSTEQCVKYLESVMLNV